MEPEMIAKFEAEYGAPPTFAVRAPGRVNLIGEHVDYSGYDVFPMALEASIHAYVRPRDDGLLKLRNVDPQYPSFETEATKFTIDKSVPSWYKYFLCGLKGAQETLAKSGSNELMRFGMDVLVRGDVAPSAGLSSSSALVCAAVMVSLHRGSRHCKFTPTEIAELSTHYERYIGTESGGMDQATCLLGQDGSALHISFNVCFLSTHYERYIGTESGGMDQATCLLGQDGSALHISFNVCFLSTHYERYIGTESGGMDQATCLLGQDGSALHISFNVCFLSTHYERYIGTESGGMDQATCLLGQDGSALHISFNVCFLSTHYERYIGTESGGMDQATCLLGQDGSALHISFNVCFLSTHYERYIGTESGGMDQATCLLGQDGSALHISFNVCFLSTHYERYIGTESGEMDQATCLLGQDGSALHISFNVCFLSTHYERYIGTESGGMDQATCLLGQDGSALHISFNPLKAVPVKLPSHAAFVVAHSGVTANKAAFSGYNERVVECRLAAMVMGKKEGVTSECRTLGALQTALGKELAEMGSLVEKHLHKEAYTREEVMGLLAMDDSTFREKCLSQNTLEMAKFELCARAGHVFSEAWRVGEFRRLSESGGSIADLGSLMALSHASCRDLYACSCPELDELVKAAEAAGSLGSRLTGAGWGGCTVSLVPTSVLPEFMPKIKKFYESHGKLEFYEKFVFVSKPAAGAEVITA